MSNRKFSGFSIIINKEKELLFECATNRGFMERLIGYFMLELREDTFTKKLIEKWEAEVNSRETTQDQSYIEDNKAFQKTEKKGFVVNFDGDRNLPEFLVMGDSNPYYLWLYLMKLEKSWKSRRVLLLNELDRLDRIEQEKVVSISLGSSNPLDDQMHYISRTVTEKLIRRLLHGIELILISEETSSELEDNMHQNTKKFQQDFKALIPFAKKEWGNFINSGAHPNKFSKEKIAEKMIKALPKQISLNAKNPITVARKAAKETDPRNYEGGRYLGLKPHWEKFDWVQI